MVKSVVCAEPARRNGGIQCTDRKKAESIEPQLLFEKIIMFFHIDFHPSA